MVDKVKFETPTAPAGGWGSVKAVTSILAREHVC
jgi:hypothetical protein